VVLDGAPVSFDTRKATALLAYLAVTGQPQQRDTLAALLWPEADQSHARGALRRTLSVLHGALQRTPLLRIERDQVELCVADDALPPDAVLAAAAEHTVAACDVQMFRQSALGCPIHRSTGAQPTGCDRCLEQLERAAEIYQDHFMAGFSLRDSAAYDDWQFFAGEELQHRLAQILELLVTGYIVRHTWQPAIRHARRRLALDTLHEPAHRQLMLLYAWSDQRAAALRQYQECGRVLNEELGVPPLAETSELYEAILNHQTPSPPARPPAHTTEAADVLPAGLRPGAARTAAQAPPLVGRTSQWEAMTAAYTAISTHGHLVVVEGEAGAGKTKLAQLFLADARTRGAAVAGGVCYAGEETLAYAPVEQLVRQALDEPRMRSKLAEIEPVWRQALQRLLPELPLEPLPPLTHEGPGSQAHFLEGITRTLGGLLHGAPPGVLLLDDLQFADNATLDLLSYLVRRLHTLPLLVLVTWCSSEVPANHRLRQLAAEAARRQTVTLLTLTPWDEDNINTLLTTSDAFALPLGIDRARLVKRLYAETRGLPLFVVEYVDGLRSGALDVHEDEWSAPHGVRQFLHARMAALSETAQQILSTAAIIGRSFDMDTVIAASGRSEEEGMAALEELLARRLIREQEGDSFDFTHPQLRGIVYAEVSQIRRRLLHRRLADALATAARRSGIGTAGVAATLSYHYELGGAPEQAAQWAVTAGEHARQVYANCEAITYFVKALALGARDPCGIYLHLGDLHTLQGEYNQALESYSQAHAVCRDGNSDGDIQHRLGRLHHRLGHPAQAVLHFGAALERLPGGTADQRALVLVDWSLAAYGMHDFDAAVRLAQAALDEAAVGGGQAVPARAYDILSLVARQQADLPAALAQAQRSLDAARRLNDPAAEMAACNSLALAHAAAGANEEAIALLQTALELSLRLGDRHREAALRNNLADLYHTCGEIDAAMHQLKLAVAIFAEVGAEAGPDNAGIWMLSEW
jgi:predicted ATPase/DNA-binding SARP family transcriptional activator